MRRPVIKTVLSMLVLFVFSIAAFAAAEKNVVTLWSFESGTTEGWHGVNKSAKSSSVTTAKDYVTEGKYALKVDIKDVKGWNQDICLNEGPFSPEFHKLKEITADVTVPDSSITGMTYQEIYLVISGKANAWYQLKAPLKAGKNELSFKIDNAKVQGEIWKVYFIVNSTEAWTGPIYVDNIKGKILGETATVKGSVKEKVSGAAVPDALVVIGDQLIKTDSSGNFTAPLASDTYKAVVVKFGFADKTIQNVEVNPGAANDLGTIELIKENEPKKEAVTVSIDATRVLRTFDKHKMYGNNLAPWHPVIGYRDNVAIQKLKNIGLSFLRIPGGDYGNQYDWKTGEVYNYDGGVSWTPELNYYGGMVPFAKRMEKEMGQFEVLPIINILTPVEKSIDQRIDYGIQWLQDMKNKGIKFRYVEIGNELDNKPQVWGPAGALKKNPTMKDILGTPGSAKVKPWWPTIKNYSMVFNEASYKIKKFDPTLKIMGPVPMQPFNQERVEGEPWKASKDAPYWVEKFLQNSWQYVDTVAVHEYPLWANNNSIALLKKPQETWPVYMPKFREWIKKYINSKKGFENKNVELALTEWNSGDENSMTAMIDNSLFCADYLGSFIKEGGDMALMWDLYTQKPGLGGGHGVMDLENDPTNKFSERGHYWVMQMFYNVFGTKVVKCESSSPNLSVYAALTDDNKVTIMAINKTKLSSANATITIAGGAGSGKAYQLSKKEYVWSKDLYRPIVNSGPSEIAVNGGSSFTYSFPPYSVTCMELSR
jgi:alpha-L-arabinofuranosidase